MKEQIGNEILRKIWEDRYRKNGETYVDNLHRVANYLGSTEAEKKEFFDVMNEGLFFPAGRTMSNSGIGEKLTLNNCFVYPSIEDSMDGIFEAVKSGALTHKAGGGIGYDFSRIRPNGTPTNNDAIASGVTSFMDVFNAQTATVMQGSRRGANMGVLSIYHPDIEDFISVKSKDGNRLNHFNLSIMVDNNFMQAMLENKDIDLHFPVYDDKFKIIADPEKWKITKKINARELWDKIMKLAYDTGEPGIMFYDNLNKYNNIWYIETITHSNPCGEYIAGNIFGVKDPYNYAGACNLGSLMLHNFVINPFTDKARFDLEKLENVIKVAVRLLDRIIDINHYPLIQYENYQKNIRTIGLGYTGLADMLTMLGLKYNSKEAREFVDYISDTIALYAYRQSIELAKEKGSFNFFEADKFVQSEFLISHCKNKNPIRAKQWEKVKEDIQKYGIRNARLLSVAPTGTMSLTFGENCSSGIEPIFSLEYERLVKIGGQTDADQKKIWIRDYAYGLWKSLENSPDRIVKEDVFVTAMDIDVNSHVDMLAAIAKNVDMSVSKTINVPEDYGFEETKDIYIRCWQYGIKGCTIFRPNPLRQGILIAKKEEKKEESEPEKIKKDESKEEIKKDESKEEIKVIIKKAKNIGLERHLNTGCGSLHVCAYFDENGNLKNTYLSKGSSGGCNNFMIGLSRMISLAARNGVGIDDIVDQLNSSGTCPSYAVRKATKHDTSVGSSCPVAIGYALKDMWMEVNELGVYTNDSVPIVKKEIVIEKKIKVDNKVTNSTDKCPECGNEIRYEGGCVTCPSCGWSRCG